MDDKPITSPKKNAVGRDREVMTDAVCEKILVSVKTGASLKVAAEVNGVNVNTARAFRRRNEIFKERCEQAEADAERRWILRMNKHSEKSSRACEWLLERRFPERWARPEVRAQLEGGGIDAEQVVQGIAKLLSTLAGHHADTSQVDAEDDLPAELKEIAAPSDESDADAEDEDVTRS